MSTGILVRVIVARLRNTKLTKQTVFSAIYLEKNLVADESNRTQNFEAK